MTDARPQYWLQQPLTTFLTAIKDFMPPPSAPKAQAAVTAVRSRPTTRIAQPSRPEPLTSRPRKPAPTSEPLSEYSTSLVPDSVWCCQNFMLGAGMVIFQPSSKKFVIIQDSTNGHWFLPKGRKDQGESLEKTALREAYEESGYQVEFLPLHIPSCAPVPPSDPDAYYQSNTEPIMVTLTSWSGGGRGRRQYPGEYLTSWYVGHIPEDAIYQPGTGMYNEQTYSSHLLTFDEAMKILSGTERRVLSFAWDVYHHSIGVEETIRRDQQAEARRQAAELTSSSRRAVNLKGTAWNSQRKPV